VLAGDAEHDGEPERQAAEILERWRAHAPQARPWTAPGNHLTMLSEPHVQALADHLRAAWRTVAAGLPT
jgi:arthrofactin-type cyclic lipopeptide synthetase C